MKIKKKHQCEKLSHSSFSKIHVRSVRSQTTGLQKYFLNIENCNEWQLIKSPQYVIL